MRDPVDLPSFLSRAAEAAVEAQERLDDGWYHREEGEGGPQLRGSLVEHAAAGEGLPEELAGLWHALAPPRPVIVEMEVTAAVEMSVAGGREVGAGVGLGAGLAVLPLGISFYARHRHERVSAGSLRLTVARAEPVPAETPEGGETET